MIVVPIVIVTIVETTIIKDEFAMQALIVLCGGGYVIGSK